ncbi:MAG: hypothetical protein N2504_07280 [candidate division WOR-3 bacterium]|nr:hypothetical protein [candidate division WOR-3 bacterium]MCX7948370.1 hypothetical protein [candidate division WOR-3 bacterium]MDW8151270.1 rod shape-determining protein MreC [candidate division WOR-3 bacterium]
MKFNDILIFVLSLLFFFKLPRVLVFENFKFLYFPIIELSNFIYHIQNLEESFKKLILVDSENLTKAYGLSFIPPIKPKEIVLNVGKNENIEYGDVLLIKNILIGKITEVYENSSIAITMFNTNFSASIIIKRSNYLGVLEGGDIPRISYISEGSDIKEGDSIFTSSLDNMYPFGLYIGIVGKVIEKKGAFEAREVILPYKFERLALFNILKRKL